MRLADVQAPEEDDGCGQAGAAVVLVDCLGLEFEELADDLAGGLLLLFHFDYVRSPERRRLRTADKRIIQNLEEARPLPIRAPALPLAADPLPHNPIPRQHHLFIRHHFHRAQLPSRFPPPPPLE